jgi:LytS/YehU family sensor histidine kinase
MAHPGGAFGPNPLHTWVGSTPIMLARRRAGGIGLSSVERRLERHFGNAASLNVRSSPDVGTSVELRLPVRRQVEADDVPGLEVAS